MTASPRRPFHLPAVVVSISPNAGGNRNGGLALRRGVSALRRRLDGGVGGASAPPPRAPGIELAPVRDPCRITTFALVESRACCWLSRCRGRVIWRGLIAFHAVEVLGL